MTGNTASITVQDTALILQQGCTLNTTVKYEGFTNADNATIAAQRDLKTLSSPLATCTIYTTSIAKDLEVGDVFKLTWPDYELDGEILRVTSISYGDGKKNEIRITATEDVFQQPDNSFASGQDPDDGWVPPGGEPLPSPLQLTYEAPYYEVVQLLGQTDADARFNANPEQGFMQSSATRPENGISANLWVDSGNGYFERAPMDFTPSANLVSDITETQQTFEVTNGEDLEFG